MFGDWEKNKVALEASRQPELMLIVDKWEQLQFVSREFFAKYVEFLCIPL
jgi:sulfur relay (sulfurtransferase) DsrC/TusE family protein